MNKIILKTMIEYKQIQNRRATAEEWLADNPILLDGEIGFDETNNNIKIGDGVRTWAELEYITTDVDLSDYYTKDETDYAIETTKQSLQYEIGDKVDNYVYEAKISDIETVLEGKADKADIPDMNNYVEKGEYEAKMDAVDNAIATKADAEETANRFSSVDNYLEQLHTDVEGKADKSDIPDMDDYVTDERFNDQMKTVKEAIDERVTNTEFGDTVKGLNGRIDGKVDTSVFTTEITNINNALGGKANKADIPSRIGQLENDKGYTTQSYVDNNYVNNQRFEERKEEFQQDLEQKVDKTGLKTINNESILGTGNIEIKGSEIDVDNYYTKSEVDAAIGVVYNFNIATGVEYVLIEQARAILQGIMRGEKVIVEYRNPSNTQFITLSYDYIVDVKNGQIDLVIHNYNETNQNTWYFYGSDLNTLVMQTTFLQIPSNTEVWSFVLEDGTEITKEIYVK